LTTVEQYRDFYAELVAGGRGDERLLQAFKRVPRERYVGPGPWKVLAGDRYVETPTADPAFVYQNNLLALRSEDGINNGEPGSHAMWLAALAPQPDQTVVHVGAGTGYYTAVLRELVGEHGAVIAYESDAELAARAARNLEHLPNVALHAASAVRRALPKCDAIYVNAGVTDLPGQWLDALRSGGRLLAPLTPRDAFGGMLLVTREPDERFAAKFVSGAMFIPCSGAVDAASSARLAKAFAQRTHYLVRSLRRGAPADSTCWYEGDGWWLSTAAPASETP
jgi:protein-L-isoaspartate(D-aspartate) O-methyltransferase